MVLSRDAGGLQQAAAALPGKVPRACGRALATPSSVTPALPVSGVIRTVSPMPSTMQCGKGDTKYI